MPSLPPVRTIALPGDLTLACRIVGDGSIPVVFAHGYSMSLDCWDRALAFLPARYRAYAYDLRGFGRSGRPGRYRLEDHAADLTALMDALAIDRAVLIGHSLGANIIQMAAIAEPSRARALVLTNGRALNLPPPDPVAGLVEEGVIAYGSVDDNRRVLRKRMPAYFDPENVSPKDLDKFVEIGACADTEALRQTLRALYSFPPIAPERFGRVSAPVLLVVAAHDRMTPIEVCRPALDMFQHAVIEIIPSSGHTPMWEAAAEWARIVFGFLDKAV